MSTRIPSEARIPVFGDNLVDQAEIYMERGLEFWSAKLSFGNRVNIKCGLQGNQATSSVYKGKSREDDDRFHKYG